MTKAFFRPSNWTSSQETGSSGFKATGKGKGHHGFTFSDLTQRLLPAIVLDAYPSRSVIAARALEIAVQMQPTPPFEEKKS